MDVVALYTAARDWSFAQIPGGCANLDHVIKDGKYVRGSIESTADDS